MTVLPPPLRAAFAALLVLSIARAFFGRPARSPRPGLAQVMVGFLVIAYTGALAAWLQHAHNAGAALAALGVELGCLAVWLGRDAASASEAVEAPTPREPPEPDEPPSFPSFDWDAFDRAREAWGRREPRPGVREPVG